MTIRRSNATDAEAMVDIWLRSVRATHDFLTEDDIASLLPLVREVVRSDLELWILESDERAPIGFLGLSGSKLEALFLAPEWHRKGGGRKLVRHARELRGELAVDVNEQNSAAVRFYESCGFVVEGRSDVDSDGRPFPLLHMRQVQGESEL